MYDVPAQVISPTRKVFISLFSIKKYSMNLNLQMRIFFDFILTKPTFPFPPHHEKK